MMLSQIISTNSTHFLKISWLSRSCIPKLLIANIFSPVISFLTFGWFSFYGLLLPRQLYSFIFLPSLVTPNVSFQPNLSSPLSQTIFNIESGSDYISFLLLEKSANWGCWGFSSNYIFYWCFGLRRINSSWLHLFHWLLFPTTLWQTFGELKLVSIICISLSFLLINKYYVLI
jgi:hypothetical protein